MVSPNTGNVYTTPTSINVQLTNGCLINQVFIYKYRTDDSGVEHLEYFRTGPAQGNVTNQYTLNPDSGYWLLPCGDYSIKVAYTLDGSTYQSVMSGKIRILTDTASITVRYPTIRSVLVRGDIVNIRWDAITKPGNEGMILSLTTPNGDSGDNVADLDITGDTMATNQFSWMVMTNTSYEDGRIPVPDGSYVLSIMPANSGGLAEVEFQIDSQATIQPVLITTSSGGQLNIDIGVNQAISRFWTLQSSSNLVDWVDMTNAPVWQGGSFSVPETLGKQFFRAQAVP